MGARPHPGGGVGVSPGRRVVLDTGLAAFLAGFRSERELSASALAGAFWESHVAGQTVRQAANRGDTTPILYWRTASGPEVDPVIERAGATLVAIECRWKERPDPADSAGLRALESTEGKRVKEKMIVCRTKKAYRLADGTWVLGVADALKRLALGSE